MRKITVLFILMILLLSCKDVKSQNYNDGTYEGGLDPDYEGYKTRIKITINDGLIKLVDFEIIDNNRKVPFDADYENHMNDPYYKEQCRNDLAGLKKYIEMINNGTYYKEIDTISGATWAFDKLRFSIDAVLEKAKTE